jgi:hypothetical protein
MYLIADAGRWGSDGLEGMASKGGVQARSCSRAHGRAGTEDLSDGVRTEECMKKD